MRSIQSTLNTLRWSTSYPSGCLREGHSARSAWRTCKGSQWLGVRPPSAPCGERHTAARNAGGARGRTRSVVGRCTQRRACTEPTRTRLDWRPSLELGRTPLGMEGWVGTPSDIATCRGFCKNCVAETDAFLQKLTSFIETRGVLQKPRFFAGHVITERPRDSVFCTDPVFAAPVFVEIRAFCRNSISAKPPTLEPSQHKRCPLHMPVTHTRSLESPGRHGSCACE